MAKRSRASWRPNPAPPFVFRIRVAIAGTRCDCQIGERMFGSLLPGESRLAKSAADRTVDLPELRQVHHLG